MRILLADTQALYRAGLRQLLPDLSPEAEVVEAESIPEIRERSEAGEAFDLIIADLSFLDSAPGGLRIVAQACRAAPLVVLSTGEARADVARAFDSGARAFIPRASPSNVVLNILRLVLAGGVYLPPSVLEERAPAVPFAFPGGARPFGLTDRQLDVLALLAEGKTNRDIAWALGLAEGTIKIHVTAILKTLGVRNRTQAVIAASRLLKDTRAKENP